MQSYEVDILIEKLPYTDRPNVEMLRFNGFITAQVNSKKRLKPSDILKLPYEVAEEEKEEREYQEKKLLYSEQGDKITTKAEADRLYKEFIQKYQVDGNK